MPDNMRIGIIEAINHPLGFFVLALLIVEAFLGIVLIYSDLSTEHKYIGMWMGLILFIMLIILVFILVWVKPKNLIFGEKGHLTEQLYGTEKKAITKLELEKSRQVEEEG